jgi:hypothetical protein
MNNRDRGRSKKKVNQREQVFATTQNRTEDLLLSQTWRLDTRQALYR